ncbi:MAG: VWA domain-containing protein [Candidatus Omnitrophica bacterium]|nr:VWA domain-containing protein [Candidatus Omnitrophota bacterium]
MTFQDPLFFLIVAAFIVLYIVLRFIYPEKSYIFPTLEIVKPINGTFKAWGARNIVFLKIAAVIFIGIALARPQIPDEERSEREGIAIMIAIDCSSTMLAEDLQLGPMGLVRLVEESQSSTRLNRIEAVKDMAAEFIEARRDDILGIVAFAAGAYVICPPTYDHQWLLGSLKRIRVGIIKDGTAIGSGILSCLDALKEVKAKSKVIILLTDGINNFGEVPPAVAAKAARALGVKIYAIGIASKGQTPFPVKDVTGKRAYNNVRIDIDESALRKIANITGGIYYRAVDTSSLNASYRDIDKLEKVTLKDSAAANNHDIFDIIASAALFILLIEIVLGNTYFRKIP